MPNLEIDILLRLAGIDGESTVRGHEKEIDVLSYEQAVDVAVVVSGSGDGAMAGKTSFSNVRFRKHVDVASVPMMLTCAAGQHLKEARFTFRHRGTEFDYYTVTLEDVLLTGIAERAGTDAQYPLSFAALNSGALSYGFLEEVSLNFSRIRWEQRTSRPGGSVAATITGGWDVRTNKKL